MTWAFHLFCFAERYDAEDSTHSSDAFLHKKSAFVSLHHGGNLPSGISAGSRVLRDLALRHLLQQGTCFPVGCLGKRNLYASGFLGIFL